MSKKLITLSVGLIATTLLFGQKDTLSKNSDQNATSALEDVIVTANKIEQKQNTTGKVVTVITAAQIQANAGRTLSEILNEQASLYLPGALSNAGTVPSIYMRGASSGRTLVMIDGVPVGDPSMISNEFDLNLVPLNQVERVEILKGAQSTMYGSDAMGGVINIITKNPTQKLWSGSLSLGTYGTRRIAIQRARKFKKLSYTIGFENQAANGYSAAIDQSNTAGFDIDGYKNNSWFLNVNYAINNNWDLKAYTRKTAYNADVDFGAFKDDKDQYFNNATQMSGLILNYKKATTRFQFQYQYATQDRDYLNDSADKTHTIFEKNQYWGKSHFADAFFAKSILKNVQWIVGSDFRYGSYQQDYYSISQWGPYAENFKDTFQYQHAIYSSLIIRSNNNKWLFELGGRQNNHSRYGSNQTFTASPSYKLNEQNRLIASISSGYKAPSLYQLSYNSALSPETSISSEIGIEHKSNDVFARAVYYNRTIDNGIDYNYIDYNFFNFIQQKVNGIELELNWKASPAHSISANYTLMNGQETNQNRITTTDTITYAYLLKRPQHTGGLTWNYKATKKLNLSVSARYTSRRYDVGGYAAPDVLLGYYTLVNAHLNYQLNRNWVLFADGQNLGNDRFQEINGYNTMGRMIMIGIRLH
jgi:vitamin B12 transporter